MTPTTEPTARAEATSPIHDALDLASDPARWRAAAARRGGVSFAPVSIRLPAAAADAILAVLPDDSSIGEWHREAVRQHLLREARRHVRAAEKRRQREAGQ